MDRTRPSWALARDCRARRAIRMNGYRCFEMVENRRIAFIYIREFVSLFRENIRGSILQSQEGRKRGEWPCWAPVPVGSGSSLR